VVEVTRDGDILQTFGGSRGSDITQLNYPWYIVADETGERFLVADRNNARLQQLGTDLRPTGRVIDIPQEGSSPSRICMSANWLFVVTNRSVIVFTLR